MRRMYDENEIKSIASESGGGKLYRHSFYVYTPNSNLYNLIAISNSNEEI